MTKLMEWLSAIVTFLAMYAALLHNPTNIALLQQYRQAILVSPVVLVAAFGIYSVWTILYRVFTFNDCQEAAEELQRQIVEARADLASKGFRFDEPVAATAMST